MTLANARAVAYGKNVYIEQETLSDGSHVYNVGIAPQEGPHVRVVCEDEMHAEIIFEMLDGIVEP